MTACARRFSVSSARLAELEQQLAEEIEAIRAALDPATEELTAVQVRPRKKDIAVNLVGLAWLPHVRDAAGRLTPMF